MNEWINCDERMPEEGIYVWGAVYGTDVIVQMDGETEEEMMKRCLYGHPRVKLCCWEGEEEGWYSDGYPMIIHPRYWMSVDFPEPPAIGQGG